MLAGQYRATRVRMAVSGTDDGINQLSEPAPTRFNAADFTWENVLPWSRAVHTWSPAVAIWAGVGVKSGSRLCTALMACPTSELEGCLLGAALETLVDEIAGLADGASPVVDGAAVLALACARAPDMLLVGA